MPDLWLFNLSDGSFFGHPNPFCQSKIYADHTTENPFKRRALFIQTVGLQTHAYGTCLRDQGIEVSEEHQFKRSGLDDLLPL